MVSENDIAKLKQDAKATVLVKSLNKEFIGTVTEISTSAKNTAGQFVVKVLLEDVSENVYPGMFVNVNFSGGTESKSGVTMAQSAIVRKGQLSGVYVVSADRVAILRWLRLGKSNDNTVEVLSGLKAGESYITVADGKLYNGANVTF